MSNPIHLFYFTLISLFWGGSFLAIGIAVDHFPPAFSAFLRSVVGMLSMICYLLWRRKTLRSKVWLQSMGCGLFTMGIAWIFVFWGEKFVAPALACVLNAAVPIFAVLLTPFMTPNDRLTRNKILGVLIGFSGVLLIFWPGLITGVTPEVKGLAAVLMMSLCYAIGVLWTRRIAQKTGGAVNLFYQCLGSALVLILFSLIFELPHSSLQWSWSGLAAVFYLGTFSTAVAWLLFFILLKEVGSLQATAVTYCMPLVAILLDFVVLHKIMLPIQTAGTIIILGGVFLINKKKDWIPAFAGMTKSNLN